MTVTDRAIQLRAPTLRDRDRVRGIVEATGIFRLNEVEIALEVFDSAVREPGRDYFAIGAFDGDRLTGWACYGPTPGTVATWDLYWIAVDPNEQRGGAGRRLMAACERDIRRRGGKLVVIETASRPDYAATRAFYDALGYGRAARIPNYYAPQDDLVVFVKPLDPLGRESANHG